MHPIFKVFGETLDLGSGGLPNFSAACDLSEIALLPRLPQFRLWITSCCRQHGGQEIAILHFQEPYYQGQLVLVQQSARCWALRRRLQPLLLR